MFLMRHLGLLLLLLIPAQSWSFTAAQLLKVDVVFAGARPGDESGAVGTLARYCLDHGLRVALLFVTSGEKEPNVSGGEAGVSLGLLRQEEARRAASAYGVHRLYFIGAEDLGQLIRAETALEHWGADRMLGVLVRIVRLTQPEILITMNPEPGVQGGQQQAVARLTTEAFDQAGDPRAFAAQIDDEGLAPWQPKKLYYLRSSPTATKMPIGGISKALLLPHARIKAQALDFYRSLGGRTGLLSYDAEEFTLAKSVALLQWKETDLLDGVFAGTGAQPVGVSMRIAPQMSTVPKGGSLAVALTAENHTEKAFREAWLELVLGTEPLPTTVARDKFSEIGPGETVQAFHQITIPEDTAPGTGLQLMGELRALVDDQVAMARTQTTLSISSQVSINVKLPPVEASYRAWASAHGLQHLLAELPTQIPAHPGEAITVTLSVDVGAISPGTSTTLDLITPKGWSKTSLRKVYFVQPNHSFEAHFSVVPPPGTPPGAYPIKAVAEAGHKATLEGSVAVTPVESAKLLEVPPQVDGSLEEWATVSPVPIAPDRICSGTAGTPEDLQGTFWIGFDPSALYLAAKVADDALVPPLPGALHPHRTADSVEIDLNSGDPNGDIASLLKLGIIPRDAEGRCRALRDADAAPGWVEAVAPGIHAAAQTTEGGYTLEVAIPYEYLPSGANLSSGDTFGLNILIRDLDAPDTTGGPTATERCLAWSAWPNVSMRPHLWGKLVLE